MAPHSWIGATLAGRYKIEQKLGQGGMATVFKAQDENLNRVVAIKLIHPHLSDNPDFVRRFEEEAKAVAQLRHPNIIQVFDFAKDPAHDVYYIVFEFLAGEPLQDHLERLTSEGRQLSQADALKYATNIADAIGYAHKRGMVHRDIKPANVMLTVQGDAVLMDFGIVKIVGGTQHTATGAVVGTARYMSPEQIKGEAVDERTDIYAFGVMLYEMLGGRAPFEADSVMTLMMQHVNDPVPDIRNLRPEIPVGLTTIINRAMAKTPVQRFVNGNEMASALRTVDLSSAPTKAATNAYMAQQATIVEAPTPVPVAAPAPPPVTGQQQVKSVGTQTTGTGAPAFVPAEQPKEKSRLPLFIGLGVGGLVIGALVLFGLLRVLNNFQSDPTTEADPVVAEITEAPAEDDAAAATDDSAPEPTSATAEEDPDPTEAPTDTDDEGNSAATGDTGSDALPKFCQVTDVGGIDDKSFNQTAWDGVKNLASKEDIETLFIESESQADYAKNINAFIEQDCDLIVTVGFLLGDATANAAEANPDQKFSIIDVAYDTSYDNVVEQIYAIDEAAFLAGYAAADVSETGIVGTFGGINIPPVTGFMDGFVAGVLHYNKEQNANVKVLGWDPTTQDGLFTGNFDSTDDGRAFAESLMDEGADVIMPVAGPVGLGSAAAIQERGNAWLIGVDTDWTQSAPEYKDIILTSVMKRMDVSVEDVSKSVLDGSFVGGRYEGTLENGGVRITDTVVPVYGLGDIAGGIIAGNISTRPDLNMWAQQDAQDAAPAPTTKASEPTATTAAQPTNTTAATAAPTETPTTAPTAAPTATTAPTATAEPTVERLFVSINGISVAGDAYAVSYSTSGYTEVLPGTHIHFFFNTVAPSQAGVPGGGPWVLWGGPRPFTGYKLADKPAGATQMCALVANADHSVIENSGNCWNLPE